MTEVSQNWRPPSGGYRIRNLPPEIAELFSEKDYQAGWQQFGQSTPTHQDVALAEMAQFLKQQGFQGPQWTEAVRQEQGRQYCEKDPRFCPKEERVPALGGTRRKARPTPAGVAAWSRHVWQMANYMLADGIQDPVERVGFIERVLTTMIASPLIGCPHCAKHWRKNLVSWPTAAIRTLQEAREWLVNIHNAASPHTPPMSLGDVAFEFGWTLTREGADEPDPGKIQAINLIMNAA